MLITKVNFIFHGLYFTGTGWKDAETKAKWDAYWRNINTISWKFAEFNDGICGVQYLVGLHGAVYLHPQVTNVTLVADYQTNTKDYSYDELCRLMYDCADACGGSVEINNYRIATVDL